MKAVAVRRVDRTGAVCDESRAIGEHQRRQVATSVDCAIGVLVERPEDVSRLVASSNMHVGRGRLLSRDDL